MRGKSHIYVVKTIDQGIEVLTGTPVGEKADDTYPEGTVNYPVEKRPGELAQVLKRFGGDGAPGVGGGGAA